MDTGWLFRASWPILQPDLPFSVLRTEACREVDQLARAAGCRLVGELTWTVLQSRLVVQASAVPHEYPEAAVRGATHGLRRVEAVRGLAAVGWSDEQIASSLGCTPTAIKSVRSRAGIRAGSQQRKGRAA